MGTEILLSPVRAWGDFVMPLCERCGVDQINHAVRRVVFAVGLRDRETGVLRIVLTPPQGPFTLHVGCLRELEARGFVFVGVRVPHIGGA